MKSMLWAALASLTLAFCLGVASPAIADDDDDDDYGKRSSHYGSRHSDGWHHYRADRHRSGHHHRYRGYHADRYRSYRSHVPRYRGYHHRPSSHSTIIIGSGWGHGGYGRPYYGGGYHARPYYGPTCVRVSFQRHYRGYPAIFSHSVCSDRYGKRYVSGGSERFERWVF